MKQTIRLNIDVFYIVEILIAVGMGRYFEIAINECKDERHINIIKQCSVLSDIIVGTETLPKTNLDIYTRMYKSILYSFLLNKETLNGVWCEMIEKSETSADTLEHSERFKRVYDSLMVLSETVDDCVVEQHTDKVLTVLMKVNMNRIKDFFNVFGR